MPEGGTGSRRAQPAGSQKYPNVTHQARKRPSTHFSLLILHIRKTVPCPTALSRPHPHFPHPTHQVRNRPSTHISLLILHIRCGIALRKSNAWSEPIIELGVPLCFCHRGAIIPVAVRRMGVFAHGLGKICNRCAEWASLRTDCCYNKLGLRLWGGKGAVNCDYRDSESRRG